MAGPTPQPRRHDDAGNKRQTAGRPRHPRWMAGPTLQPGRHDDEAMTSTTAATSSEWRRGDPGLRAGKETPLRFYPTPEQAAELSRTFGCVRKVYNLALEGR